MAELPDGSHEASVRPPDLLEQSRAELQTTASGAVEQLYGPLQLSIDPALTPTATPPRPVAKLLMPTVRMGTSYRTLAPAPPPRRAEDESRQTTFLDLPAELRVEIYKLVLENVIIHILPSESSEGRRRPHALMRTSRQVRNEAIPIIHSSCRIRANVTDFNFLGMLSWMQRIPPTQQHHLLKNPDLQIILSTSGKPNNLGNNMRQWLHMRADPYRVQPKWKYSGAQAQRSVANDLRRRVKRMPEQGKREELKVMLEAIKVQIP